MFLNVDNAGLPSAFYARVPCANTGGLVGMPCRWSVDGVLSLSAGEHDVSVMAAGTNSGSNATVSGDTSSVHQGTLSVLVLKE